MTLTGSLRLKCPIRLAIWSAIVALTACAGDDGYQPPPRSSQSHEGQADTLVALGARPAKRPAIDPDEEPAWRLTVASWNLLNFGTTKSTFPGGAYRTNLLDRMAQIASQYEVLIFQEVLNDAGSVTNALHSRPGMNQYDCTNFTGPSGRIGRQERYVLCYLPVTGDGTLALNQFTDYLGGQYQAVDGTQQTAQNVWMRPPFAAQFTFTPDDRQDPPYDFTLYTNHTKPSYGSQAIPPGTPQNARASSSVHYELQALQGNLLGHANQIIMGDLNADCGSYPVSYRGQDFGAGWTWFVNYGERTNTAPGTACAYDRIILNNAIVAGNTYKDHGINYDHYDNATRLDQKLVSDHYLVWLELGADRKKKRRKLMASTSTAVSTSSATRAFTSGSTINFFGTGFLSGTVNFFVTAYNQATDFMSYAPITLTDVRGAPTAVTIGADGSFSQNVVWDTPLSGTYSLVIDVDRDGIYNRTNGDFVNFGQQIDIIVTSDTSGHNNLVSMGDNAQLRDLFDIGKAINIYALAKNLPANHPIDMYVLSRGLLAASGYTTWAQVRSAGIQLPPFAVPVNAASGPILVGNITAADRVNTVLSNDGGTLLAAAWEKPSRLYNTHVYTSVPPVPRYEPAYAGDGIPGGPDPCDAAFESTDANFRAVCNFGNQFTDYYGKAYTIWLDVNRNGVLDDGDELDTRDIGDMTTYFGIPTHTVLDASANGDPAVGEYKEYLDAALSLNMPLSSGNIYDAGTQGASFSYICSPGLSKDSFNQFVTGDAETGFRLLYADEYATERQVGSGLYFYENASLHDFTATAGANICTSVKDELHIGGFSGADNSKTNATAGDITVHDDVQLGNDASACLAAANTFEVGVVTATIATSETIVGSFFVFVGGTGVYKIWEEYCLIG